MSFLKKLFGGEEPKHSGEGDTDGFFVYIQCDKCGTKLRLRINKQYDLMPSGDGYTWHKTIVDSKCFQRVPTVAHFDRNYKLVNADMDGARFITREEYEATGATAATGSPTPKETDVSAPTDGDEDSS